MTGVTERVRRAGLVGMALVVAAGLWLAAAPWATGQQPRAAAWTAATGNDVCLGAALTTAGLAAFFVVLAGRVRELYEEAGHMRR